MGKGGSERKQEGTVMSEDASVNTGAAGWPSDARAFLAVRRMQTKLHCWAVTDRDRRFDDLYNLVCDPAFLTIAWERVAGNKGAHTPGVDRATVARITSGVGVEAFLQQVRDELKSRTFVPDMVRQVMIPKASGKLRKLGIPTVTDRVVQAALKLVLEPIFEADFQSCSYGFRPNRRAHDAIAEIHHFTSKSYQWVLEADIEAWVGELLPTRGVQGHLQRDRFLHLGTDHELATEETPHRMARTPAQVLPARDLAAHPRRRAVPWRGQRSSPTTSRTKSRASAWLRSTTTPNWGPSTRLRSTRR